MGRNYGTYDPNLMSESPKVRFRLLRNRSAQQRTWVELTLEEYDALTINSKPCHYCLGPLALAGCRLSRINPDLPYRVDNVVPSCRDCGVKRRWHNHHKLWIARFKTRMERKLVNRDVLPLQNKL